VKEALGLFIGGEAVVSIWQASPLKKGKLVGVGLFYFMLAIQFCFSSR
jgi:hypothetical protein